MPIKFPDTENDIHDKEIMTDSGQQNFALEDTKIAAENIFVGEIPLEETNANAAPVERYDLRIMRSLRQITRSVDIHSRQLSQKYDITAPQLVTLLSIVNSYSTTIANIAKDVHLSPSTLVGIVDRLERKGLVRRDRSTSDRRQVYITITPKGVEFADSAPSPLQETLSQALIELSELEQSSIALSLERVVELMDKDGIGYTGNGNTKK